MQSIFIQNIARSGAVTLWLLTTSALIATPVSADDLGDLGTLQGSPSKARSGSRSTPTTRSSPARTQRSKPQSAKASNTRTTSAKSGRSTSTTKTSTTKTRPSVDLTGTWETTDGWTVRFIQNGTSVTGNYTGEHVRGTIRGTFDGKELKGTFDHRQGSIAFSGDMNLAYSNGKLEGEWNAGDYSEPISATRTTH